MDARDGRHVRLDEVAASHLPAHCLGILGDACRLSGRAEERSPSKGYHTYTSVSTLPVIAYQQTDP